MTDTLVLFIQLFIAPASRESKCRRNRQRKMQQTGPACETSAAWWTYVPGAQPRATVHKLRPSRAFVSFQQDRFPRRTESTENQKSLPRDNIPLTKSKTSHAERIFSRPSLRRNSTWSV